MADSRLCSIEDCGKPVRALGLCRSHHYRQAKHGSPYGGRVSRGALAKWLKDHVSYDHDACLIWPFGSNNQGYGQLTYEKKDYVASRFMCILVNGEPPQKNLEAAHSCGKGNLGCVSPKHLEWKTPKGNQADRIIHGTNARGETVNGAKLSEDDVRSIRASKETHRMTSLRYGITRECVTAIKRRRSWGWLPD